MIYYSVLARLLSLIAHPDSSRQVYSISDIRITVYTYVSVFIVSINSYRGSAQIRVYAVAVYDF